MQDYHNLIKEGKTGIGRLVLRCNGKIPVVPMYIHGSHEALRGRIIPKFKSFIGVSICKPLFFAQLTRKEGWDASSPEFYSTARKIVNKIMTSIREQMLKQEEVFIKILEGKFRNSIEKIHISPESKPKVDKILYKLLEYHHEDLEKYSDTIPQN